MTVPINNSCNNWWVVTPFTYTTATPTSKGGKKPVGEVDLYAVKMKIWEELTIKEEMLIKLHEDGML